MINFSRTKGHKMADSIHDVSRREILATSFGAASAALLASGCVSTEPVRLAGLTTVPEPLKPAQGAEIRCGIIGVGGRGMGVLNGIHGSAGVRVTAICDLDDDKMKKAAELVGADHPRLFKNYKEMLKYDQLDAVAVATPCYLHAEMAIAVLKSGRHCYGEKPMALNTADLDAMVRAVESSRRVYQVGTQLPYADPWRGAIKTVQTGVIGDPILIRAHRHNGGDLPHHIPWFFNRKMCGDIILEQAVHEFDIFNAVMQGIPVRAAGFGGQALRFDPAGRNIRDHYAVVFDYGENRKVSYSHSYISIPNLPCDGRSEFIYGTRGIVDVEYGMIYPREGQPRKIESESPGDSTQLAIDNFFDCIRHGRQPLTDVIRGRNSALVALIGLKAMDTGRVVSMKELLTFGYSA